jgi:hypothetical protein
MMLRTFDLTLTEVGATLGIVTILCSIAGTFLAGFTVDLLSARGYKDAPVRAAIYASLLALPMIFLAPPMPSAFLSWCLIGLYLMFISAYATLGLLTAAPNVRGQLTAFITNFILADASALNWSISITGGLTLPFAAWLFKTSLTH